MLWLWCRPVATAPIQPLAWEPPYAMGAAQEIATTTTTKDKRQKKKIVITLNVNGLNAPTKRHRLAEWIQKQDPYICCLQETHFSSRDTYKLKVKGWKKIFHANGDQKKAGVARLTSDKIDFKMNILKDKKGQYIMVKGSIQEEDITILNIYTPNTGSPQYIRQLLTNNLKRTNQQ